MIDAGAAGAPCYWTYEEAEQQQPLGAFYVFWAVSDLELWLHLRLGYNRPCGAWVHAPFVGCGFAVFNRPQGFVVDPRFTYKRKSLAGDTRV